MDKKLVATALRGVMYDTELLWKPHHKDAVQALRWWMAFTDAEESVDSYNMREWAEVFLDGLQPTPETFQGIVDEIQDRIVGREELEGIIQSIKAFFSSGEGE